MTAYDPDSFAPGGARPAPRAAMNNPYTPPVFNAPTFNMPMQQTQQPMQQPQPFGMPQYQAPAAPMQPAPVAQPEQPAASEKDDLDVPAFLRRKR